LGMTLIYLITGRHPAALPYVNGRIKFTAEISNFLRGWLETMTQPYLDKRFDSDRSAQTALVSNDGSYGGFTNFKPANCTTKLYRDRDRLEISLHNNRLVITSNDKELRTTSEYMSMSGCLLWIAVLIIGVVFPVYGVNFIPLYFSAIFVLWTLTGNVFYKARINAKSTTLIVKRESIRAIETINYSSKHQKTLSYSPRVKSDPVIYNPGYTFDEYLDSDLRIVQRGRVIVRPELQIYCGLRKYSFGGGISQPELYWLGQEISDFLNLELQVIYPTPQAPLKPPEPPEASI
jgi:hypothetical protein